VAKTVAVNVVGIHEDTREPRWFRPGDTVPAEYQASLSNPAVYEDASDGGDGGEPEPAALQLVEDDTTDASDGDDGEEPTEPEFEDNYDELKGDDLRAELANRGLPVHGRNQELIDRLREDDAEEA
jgi:hypothetical protein